MSLLMKALEKAAKDREGSDPAAHQAPAPSELTLEPIAQVLDAPAAIAREPGREPARELQGRREPALQAGQAARAAIASGATPRAEAAKAATVIKAGQREPSSGVSAYVREHPLITFGTFAGLFLAAYATYVYLQMTNPGLFVKQPIRTTQPAPITPPPAAPSPPAAAATLSGAGAQQPLSTALLLPSTTEAVAQDKVLAGNPSMKAPERLAAPPAAASPGPSTAAAAAPASASVRDTIKVTRGGAAAVLSPVLSDAFQSLEKGDGETAQRLYGQLLQSEPNNIDALLGLAAVATQRGNSDAASKQYIKVLELDPRNPLAQAGLISLLGRADPVAAETRLKQLIAREPSAYLHFTLGNVYADQNRWPDAQQSYFQAHHMQPDNPDYAYNLAVGLEHLGQSKLALDFYRRATALATAKGRANFSTAAATERIVVLEKAVQ